MEIFSNGDTACSSEVFWYNKDWIKLWMNYQCVQLARVFYYKITWKDSYKICKDLNSSCWFKWRKKLDIDEIMYDDIKVGDMVVFSWWVHWHIALISQVVTDWFFIVQQNFFNNKKDINHFISFQDVIDNNAIIDPNWAEYFIEDFLRIKK